jgi:hypothetical protein
LLLELLAEGLHVGFRWDPEVGQPPRHERKKAFVLQPGDYGRVVVNGRHASDEGHWYSQETFNVAVGEDLVEQIFTARQPGSILDLRENLL